MKTALIASAFAAALVAGSTASAATVQISGNESRLFTLNNVSDATLSFSVPTTEGYENFGGAVKWSSREDGRQDGDSPGQTCLWCGYDAGSWKVEYNPWEIVRPRGVVNSGRGTDPSRPGRGNQVNSSGTSSSSDLFIDFGDTRETVYLCVNPTYGRGSVSLEQTRAADFAQSSAAEISAVPLPAGAWLLITALGAIALIRRRKTA